MIKILNLTKLSKEEYQKILKRSFGRDKEVVNCVKKIMEKIKTSGNREIIGKYQKRFGREKYRSIKVMPGEIVKAYKEVDGKFIRAIKQMIKNITAVHKEQLPKKIEAKVVPEKGISVWRVWRPIEKVGLYVPGGRAVYPSSVLMTAIPARIAGSSEIIMCSPPAYDGQIPAATLVAADLVGLKNIYKVGGAEAIAAMTYGTESIPKVYKIYGAGNSYVTTAKMLALEEVAIDMPAGPSEVMILIDGTANPKYVVSDLLADAEHGPDSACTIVVLKSQKSFIVQDCVREIEKQVGNLLTCDRIKESLDKYGAIVEVDTIEDAVEFINDYAPEHLEIMTNNPEKIVPLVQNAGSVFLGPYTTKSAGDYATGANHVLPTGGTAKMYPPLGVDAFGKWMQVQKCTKEGLRQIKNTIETVAIVEQLPAHKNSATIRFIKN